MLHILTSFPPWLPMLPLGGHFNFSVILAPKNSSAKLWLYLREYQHPGERYVVVLSAISWGSRWYVESRLNLKPKANERANLAKCVRTKWDGLTLAHSRVGQRYADVSASLFRMDLLVFHVVLQADLYLKHLNKSTDSVPNRTLWVEQPRKLLGKGPSKTTLPKNLRCV